MLLTISLLFLAAPLAAMTLTGEPRVVDGDTVVIAGQSIRLHGIDTPEVDQTCRTEHGVAYACGDIASAALRQLVEGAPMTCRGNSLDRYQRLIAVCESRGRDVNAAMVASGYATAYRRYSRAYVPLEEAARAAGRGFWSGAMQSPEAHRKRDRSPAPDRACALKGNISGNGRIVHAPGQEHYNATRIDTSRGERWFCSLDEAIAAGWRPARR